MMPSLHRLVHLLLFLCFIVKFDSHGQQLSGASNLSGKELKAFHTEESNFKKQRNTFLSYVTRGQELSLRGQLNEGNDYFEKAYWLLDSNKHRLPHTDHYGYSYEGFMILYLKGVNYFELQKPELALVECNRMRDWLNLEDLNLSVDRFNSELFPHMLLGFLYEAEGMPNDALIEYQISYRLYQQSEEFFGTSHRQAIQTAILRTCLAAGLDEKFTSLQEEFMLTSFKKTEEAPGGTLTIVCHLGVGPLKSNYDEPADYQTNANALFGPVMNAVTRNTYKFETAFAINPWRHANWWTSLPRGIYFVTVPLHIGGNTFLLSYKDVDGNPKEFRFEIQGTGKHYLQVINTITPAVSEYVSATEAEKYLRADSIQADQGAHKKVAHLARKYPFIFFPDRERAASERSAYYNSKQPPWKLEYLSNKEVEENK